MYRAIELLKKTLEVGSPTPQIKLLYANSFLKTLFKKQNTFFRKLFLKRIFEEKYMFIFPGLEVCLLLANNNNNKVIKLLKNK